MCHVMSRYKSKSQHEIKVSTLTEKNREGCGIVLEPP